MAKIRILLIEENRILREGIASTIKKQGDIALTAISDGKDKALAKARIVKPQLALMDLGLNNRNRLDLVNSLRKEFPDVKIVGMGLNPAQSDILDFVQAGTQGFILKNGTIENIVKTIRIVAQGGTVLPQTMAGSLFSQLTGLASSKRKKMLKSSIRLTQREREIIALIVDGMSNKEIAGGLNIATFTVKSHVHNILEKLGLQSRLQIAKHFRPEKNL